MRRLLILALLCMAGGGCTTAPVAYSRAHAVVTVWMMRTTFGSGSAVVIDCRPTDTGYRVTALTAKHCLRLRDINGFTIMLQQGAQALAGGEVVAMHPQHDVALVAFASPDPVPVVRLATVAPSVLDRLTVVGYAGGRGNRWVAEGVACDEHRGTTPVAPGDSGGAVLNAAGELVGVISGVNRLRSGEHVNHHLHLEPIGRLREWLAGHLLPL